MNVQGIEPPRGGGERAVAFSGTWQEFLPIALVNLLLTIVTLGIYRFWAQARVRRYLWSRTRLVGSNLEWTGTGGEMFIGFLMVMGILLGAGILIFGGAALLGRWFLLVGGLGFYLFLFWGFGFAQFRALRYRLSRTYWRGIRGGSDDSGVAYGWTALGRNFLAGLTLGIMTPNAIVKNWNDRLRAMSFGPHRLQSDVDTAGLQARWMMVYPVYIAGLFAIAWSMPDPDAIERGGALGAWLPLVAIVVGLALVMTAFWALFFRKAAESFRMGDLSAGFEVSTAEWIALYARMAGLAIITLGFGALMWRFLSWKFVMDRLALYGEVELDTLTQSTTAAPKDAEGFADAFDIGAF